MRGARKIAWWPVTLLVSTLAAAGCQLFVDLGGLEDMSCPPEYKACNGQCVSERDIATGCGDTGCDPCGPQHANATCDKNNHCSFTTCIGRWANCDMAEDTGCETDLDHTAKNCGACGIVCPDPAHAKAGCSMGFCGVGKCEDGWGDCDLESSNGCEQPIWTDLECTTCRVPCPAGETCDKGTCGAPVSDGGAG